MPGEQVVGPLRLLTEDAGYEYTVLTVAYLLECFTAWIRAQPDVQAAALVSSYARYAAAEGLDEEHLWILAKP